MRTVPSREHSRHHAKRVDLPVEQLTEFELALNRRTAQALGLAIPPSVLVQVTEVIQ